MDAGRAYWDVDTTKIFLNLCIDEKNKLNYNNKGLTKDGWHNLYANFRRQTGKKYGPKQLQNKFNTLKRQYKAWKKLKDKSGAGWDQNTHTINCTPEWWKERIAVTTFLPVHSRTVFLELSSWLLLTCIYINLQENPDNKQFKGKALPHYDELYILFDSMDSDDGTMLCVGGIGDKTPSGGSEDNIDPMPEDNVACSDDNVGRSGVGRVGQRPVKEHVGDSPPPKKTKSMEYYVERISESMMERSKNEKNALSREQDEVTEMLQLAEQDGVPNGSELYFKAAELFRSPARRAIYRSIAAAKNRIAWIQWTWDNVKKK